MGMRVAARIDGIFFEMSEISMFAAPVTPRSET
jgi:hypothetical protein